MKQAYLILLSALFFSSCATQSQLIETNDPYKKTESIKLVQRVVAKQGDPATGFSSGQTYTISLIHFFEVKDNGESAVSIDLHMETPIRTNELDSVMFFDLDNEKIRIVADEYKYKQFVKSSEATSTSIKEKSENEEDKTIAKTTIVNRNYQRMSRHYTVPENLWVSIANTEKIRFRIYLGKDGFNVHLNQEQNEKLKYFFQLAICKRDAKTPPLPEGQKKW